MKKLLTLIVLSAMFIQIAGCGPGKPPIQYIKVINITAKTNTVVVTHTENSGDGAGGAAAGALTGLLLGGKVSHIVTGGIVGYGISHDPKSKSWTQAEEHTVYTAYFSNGDSTKTEVQTSFRRGDSVCVCHYMHYCIYE